MATIMEPETQEQAGAPRPTPAGGGAAPAASPGGRRRTVFLIMGVVLLGLVGFGARRWWFNLSHVSTDNAQVDGHIIPILPKVGGFVTLVRTDDNRRVQAGDTLVVLDDRDYRVRLAQAEADLAVALAGVSNKARVGQAEARSEEHTSELQSPCNLVCRLLLEKKKKINNTRIHYYTKKETSHAVQWT